MRLLAPHAETCQETTGFLFSHACAERAANRCDECQKLTCEAHTVLEGVSTYCTSCAKRLEESTRKTAVPRKFQRSNPYDPYWYSDSYYIGYGYYGPGYWGHSYLSAAAPGGASAASPPRDPNDFNQADTAAVEAEGDANFENEIGGS
jgi:hypothetical protein